MEAKRVVKEMDKPQWIPGLGLPFLTPILAFGVCFMVATFSPVGFVVRCLLAVLLFVTVLVIARLLYRIDPKFFELWSLSLRLGSYYDPALREDQDEFPALD